MHDLVIRGGTVVDGTGAKKRTADVAIDGDRIVAVADEVGEGRREIDASGLLVTPGWVAIHTHYDGQATWDTHVTPSSWHGVTTIEMGNCGVTNAGEAAEGMGPGGEGVTNGLDGRRRKGSYPWLWRMTTPADGDVSVTT